GRGPSRTARRSVSGRPAGLEHAHVDARFSHGAGDRRAPAADPRLRRGGYGEFLAGGGATEPERARRGAVPGGGSPVDSAPTSTNRKTPGCRARQRLTPFQ